MSWLKMEGFDPQISPEIHGDRFLLAGTYPNGVRWVDCAYWDNRGWFAGHRSDPFKPQAWQPLPVYLGNE